MTDREVWLAEMRRRGAEQEDALAGGYDDRWGTIDELHRAFVERLLGLLPPAPRVLDAACGTGNYLSLVIERGGSIVGVDQAAEVLAVARGKHSDAVVLQADLHDLPFRNAFHGVMCIDAMEFVPPEGWPVVLSRFKEALHPGGIVYLTVELHTETDLRRANEAALVAGHPVVEGEVLWEDEGGGYYHHHPSLDRVRSWLDATGFDVVDEREGPWADGYAYHHVLTRPRSAMEP